MVEIQQTGLRIPPHLSCIGSTREKLANCYIPPGARHPAHRCAARRHYPSGMVEIGECATPTNWWNSSIAEHGDWFHIRVAAYLSTTRRRHRPGPILPILYAKPRQEPIQRSPSIFSMPTLTFAFVDEVSKQALISRSCRESCRSAILANWPVSLTLAARNSALVAIEAAGAGEDIASIRDLGLDVVAGLCENCWQAAHPDCTSAH